MKAKPKDGTFTPPDIAEAVTLRPAVVARLELLRIVSQWRPQWDAQMIVKAASEMEKFVSGS